MTGFFKNGKSAVLLTILIVQLISADEKWVWKSEGRNAGRGPSARYEIFENEFEPNHQQFGPQLGPINRPGSYGQYGQYGQNRPPPINSIVPGPGGFGNVDYQNNFGSHGQTPDVLVGPSYGKGPFQHIDSCKCTERFNCRGLAYGNCDVGKQYCCVGSHSGPPPSRPIHSPENGVLVGPGGGHNRPSYYPNRPVSIRETYGGQEVLVGPGGPAGIGGRPINGPGPSFGIENGVLVGPGGREDRQYPDVFPYRRSSTKN